MTFTIFGNTLPNPSVRISYAGEDVTGESPGAGNLGPGYASVKVEGEYKTMQDSTNSGRLVSRSAAYHRWLVDITYNPMTRTEFSPVYSFLLEKQGKLRPFFVTLPQYATSQDTDFAKTLTTYNGTDNDYSVSPALQGYAAGATYFRADATSYNNATDGYPLPGDMFTLTDSTNTNHTKAYKITRVETTANYNTTLPGGTIATNELRIHFTPPLQRFTANDSTIVLTNPKIKVVMANDLVGYQLKTDNLYVFSLNLEEVQ